MPFADILQLDTRPNSREEVLDQLRTSITWGSEVSDPELSAACAAGNLDPQHLGGRGDLSAIETVTTLLRGEANAATVRPDLDSLGSMAVLDIAMDIIQRARALEGDILRRIELIGQSDRFERGGWPGVRPLPTAEQPWFEAAGASEIRSLAPMAAVVQDRSLPLERRVELLKLWLATGEEPAGYREKVEAERRDMIRALVSGEIKISEAAGGRIAVVVSTHRAGVGLGYHRAPVVVAVNPTFTLGGGDPHVKFTTAQFETGFVNMAQVRDELNELEAAAKQIPRGNLKNAWGGPPNMANSPQGESSLLSLDEVVWVVERHLL